MKRIYLDVSSLANNYLYDYIKNVNNEFCISELTLFELKSQIIYDNTNENNVDEILKKVTILKVNTRILRLAKSYIQWEVISREHYNDALHIATARYYNCYTIIYDKEKLKEKNIDFNRLLCYK